MMNAKEKRAMQLEIHRMTRMQNEYTMQHTALESECARLRAELSSTNEKLAITERQLTDAIQRELDERIKYDDMRKQIMESVATNYAHTQLICNMGFDDKRVLLFSHYSKREEVESHNYFTLEELDDRFDIVIILTNCPNAWELNHPDADALPKSLL